MECVYDPNKDDEKVKFPSCLVEFLPCLSMRESKVDLNSPTMNPEGLDEFKDLEVEEIFIDD